MMIAYIPLDEQNSESNILSLVTWSVSGNNYVYLRIHKLNAQKKSQCCVKIKAKPCSRAQLFQARLNCWPDNIDPPFITNQIKLEGLVAQSAQV